MPLENKYAKDRYGLTNAQRADQEFMAKARKISPIIPDALDQREKLHRARETRVARVALAIVVAGVLYGFIGDTVGFYAAGLGVATFIATCFYAGNRAYRRNGGDHGPRPF